VRESGKPNDADAAMERYAAGNDAAFAEVYDALSPRLLAYLRRQTRDEAFAEDVVQQTFLHMHRARGTFIRGSSVFPWAFAIARRLIIDGARRGRRDLLAGAAEIDGDEDAKAEGGTADQEVEARELARRLQTELSKLPASQRAAFELLRIEGLSHHEAAEVLGATVSAVKLRAHRAYVALRSIIGPPPD
jgi:RNA polymerase sigma-70 factor (ECF subfamily)